MTKPFPCCNCPACVECSTLFGYAHRISLCGVTAVTDAALSTAQQAENDAVAAWINSNFNDVSMPLSGTTISYNWGPYAGSVVSQFARVKSLLVTPGTALPFNGVKDFGGGTVVVYPCDLYNAWLTLGAQWATASSRPCDPGYYWWLSLDLRESATPPDDDTYSFCMYGGNDYTGKAGFSTSGGTPYKPPPRSCVLNTTADCVPPSSTLNAGGLFSEIEITNTTGLGKIPVDNPFLTDAELTFAAGSMVSAAPACTP